VIWLALSAIAGVVVVGVICLAAAWGQTTRLQRWGLVLVASGFVGAAADRALQRPVGLFDVMMLMGLALYLVITYGPAIWKRADALDGHQDGQIKGL